MNHSSHATAPSNPFATPDANNVSVKSAANGNDTRDSTRNQPEASNPEEASQKRGNPARISELELKALLLSGKAVSETAHHQLAAALSNIDSCLATCPDTLHVAPTVSSPFARLSPSVQNHRETLNSLKSETRNFFEKNKRYVAYVDLLLKAISSDSIDVNRLSEGHVYFGFQARLPGDSLYESANEIHVKSTNLTTRLRKIRDSLGEKLDYQISKSKSLEHNLFRLMSVWEDPNYNNDVLPPISTATQIKEQDNKEVEYAAQVLEKAIENLGKVPS